ncbi:MAG TPA: hypothetical protein VE153_26820 [Myxococcus sp.]|jgi:hypothetical protein|nr:hypothetical protein [Myxococcus sp.]
MRRVPTFLPVLLLLSGTSGGAGSGPGASDAGVPAEADGGTVIAPSRLAEARAMVPAPLLYGQLQPTVGTWVEYDYGTPQGTFRVRAALVGETVRKDGTRMFQLELDYATKPRTLVVIWLLGGERPMVDRLAVSVPPNAPISIPVDLYADEPQLRGVLTREKDTEVRGGSFAGKARQRDFRLESGRTASVVTTPKVPLFGVESVRGGEATWVARKSGTGAKPELSSVPIAIPRLPGQ